MARNVEIKARLRDPLLTGRIAARLAGGGPRLIEQHDRFYRARRGRLKLRRFPDGGGELIAYERPDRPDPATSDYRLYRTADPEALDAVLAAALEPAGEVRKRRQLFLVGRTRVHLDRVEGLGDFLELEVVLEPGETVAEGRREAERLLAELQVDASDLLAAAYVDLLAARPADDRD